MKTDSEKRSEFLQFINDALYHARINGFKQNYGGGMRLEAGNDSLKIFFNGDDFEIFAKDVKTGE